VQSKIEDGRSVLLPPGSLKIKDGRLWRQITENVMNIYPVPTKDYVQVEFDDRSLADIQLITLDGSILQSVRTDESVLKINLTEYNPGIYILRIMKNNKVYTYKILKE
jgi:hypothetical protein